MGRVPHRAARSCPSNGAASGAMDKPHVQGFHLASLIETNQQGPAHFFATSPIVGGKNLEKISMDLSKLKSEFQRIHSDFIGTRVSAKQFSPPQYVLAMLSFTLFFPLGFMYFGVLAYLCALIADGDYKRKWVTARTHPMFLPILCLSLFTCMVALIHAGEGSDYWSSFAHYQIYLFLLLFLSVGSGGWQSRSISSLKLGAVIAATLFYFSYLNLLPEMEFFKSYNHYKGNKSILLGLLLAITAGYMIYESLVQRKRHLPHILATIYITIALIFFSKNRTATVIFVCLCCLIVIVRWRFSWRGLVALSAIFLALGGGLIYMSTLPPPQTCLVQAMRSDSPFRVVQDRVLCTLDQVRALSQGRSAGDDGMRVEIYKLTLEIIAEKPFSGHGISTWVKEYNSRSKGLSSNTMTTPHNDFLLYATELGVVGLAGLLWLLAKQLFLAANLGGQRGMQLAMLTLAMLIAGMFNAVLRDGVFGMAFMILLAIPLAGMSRDEQTPDRA